MTERQRQIYKENAIKEFIQLANARFANAFYSNNNFSLNSCIDIYKLLKDIYKSENGKIVDNYCFRHIFESFYAMARGIYVTNRFAEAFYQAMDTIREKGVDDKTPISVALDLSKETNGKVQFSFVTKMFNLENDEKYPIYDSKVALIFNFLKYELQQADSNKKHIYSERYALISETYEELIKKEDILSVFKSKFKNAAQLSNMRLVDILIWQLGKDKDKKLQDAKKMRNKRDRL